MKEQEANCRGCKWLDEVRSQSKGSGYCCHILQSKQKDKNKVRRSESTRCELYEKGDFATRYENTNRR